MGESSPPSALSLLIPARAPWGVRPRRATRRQFGAVAAVATGLGVATVVLAVVLHRVPAPDPTLRIAPWLLALLFAVAELLFVPVRFRRSAHGISLSEAPLVVGLAAAAPLELILARLLGAGAGLVYSRNQRGVKLAFNLTLMTLQAGVAAALYPVLRGGASPTAVRGWLAALAAVLVVDALAAVLVTAVIVVHDDVNEWRNLPLALVRGAVPAAATSCLALVALLATRQDEYAGVLLLVVAGVGYVAYQRYVSQSETHARVERLYDFTQELGHAVDVDVIVHTVLAQSRDELRAQAAELLLPEGSGSGTRRWWLGGPGLKHLPQVISGREWWAPALQGSAVLLSAGRHTEAGTQPVPRDGMAVPLQLEEGHLAVLAVSDSLADITTFEREDLRLLQAMANHAAVALANARAVERLRRQAADEEHNALHDPLTGLPNRRCFLSHLAQALEGASDEAMVAVLLMDLNGFKDINDTLGHDFGDRLLVEVGARLTSRLRGRGLVARLGGDEFAVLLSGVRHVDEVCWTAEQVQRSLAAPVALDSLSLAVGVSVGVALAPEHGREAGELLQHADVAMYAAKTGHSGMQVYQPADDRNTHRRLVLLASLRRALDQGEVTLAYQPKVEPRSGRVLGAEALARWDHPQLGRVCPEEFVPLAEHAGLIRPLTLLVLEGALRQCAQWRADGHAISVSVNLSARDLVHVGLPDDVARLLLQAGVHPSALTLEITESSIMADPRRSAEVLARIAALGVSLSVDDFGAGYSSLAYLSRLPVSEVKIDKSFVLGAATGRTNQSIVRAIVQLAHELGLRVVAEGVEDAETCSFLQRHSCDVVQGYYFSRPLPPQDLERWLSTRRQVVDLTEVR